jgi:dolichol-phosphate mannosyltransferase
VRAVVNAGSSSEYGLMDHPPHEGELPRPNSAYAVAKCAATLLCGSLARERQQAITTLRLYSAYGPWEEPGRLMPTLVLHGLSGTLPPLADPAIARDFVFVEDVAEAFLLAAAAAQPGAAEVFNVGSGRQTSLGALAETSRALFGIRQQPDWGRFPPRGWDTDVWVADPRAIAEALGWRADSALEVGLEATARWFEGAGEGVRERYGAAAAAARG